MHTNWVEDFGLVFERITAGASNCLVDIVMMGREKCGKTELVEFYFGDHSSYQVEEQEMRVQYTINLSNTAFRIWILDVKDIEFIKLAEFRDKTVFLFCYDVNDPESLADLEERWIPEFMARSMNNMYWFLVGIKHDPNVNQSTVNGTNRRDGKMATRERVKDLLKRFRLGWTIECSLDDRDSMANVFQSVIDTVYPRTTVN
ncbi:unnamed protein product [Larinioides sclopetarius]|uniref:P-loop containing nucleoside triphosphate hydrolase protein n=1 Tax=Larinioides sclopetarius TaxID=280406 RepID=A0AAV2BDW2_9ARAC